MDKMNRKNNNGVKTVQALAQMKPDARFREVKIQLLMNVRHVRRATAEAMLRAKDQKQAPAEKPESEPRRTARRLSCPTNALASGDDDNDWVNIEDL